MIYIFTFPDFIWIKPTTNKKMQWCAPYLPKKVIQQKSKSSFKTHTKVQIHVFERKIQDTSYGDQKVSNDFLWKNFMVSNGIYVRFEILLGMEKFENVGMHEYGMRSGSFNFIFKSLFAYALRGFFAQRMACLSNVISVLLYRLK